MAKYLAQIFVLGAQVVGRAFARAIREEFVASQAAAQRGNSSGRNRQQTATNLKMGMTVQEAKDILNISEMEPEQVQKNYEHLFGANDKSKGGSFYIQSKASPWQYQASLFRQLQSSRMAQQSCLYSTYPHVFSNESKQKCIERLGHLQPFYINQKKVTREAAVLVPFCLVDGEPSVLLTLRSTNLERHRGGVSFPGGMMESSDENLIQTALRETEEEIGISSGDVDVWTTLTPVTSRSGKIKITPVVANVGNVDTQKCCLNADEVELLFSRTLQSLCNPTNCKTTQFRHRYGYTLPVFVGGEHRIWGITAAILHFVLLSLVPESYNKKIEVHKFKV